MVSEIKKLGFKELNVTPRKNILEKSHNNLTFCFNEDTKQLTISKFTPNKIGTYDIVKIHSQNINCVRDLTNLLKKFINEN